MSMPNDLLSKKLCHYLNQGRALMTLMRINRRNKVALKTTCIRNLKLKIVKMTGCQYIRYFNYSENLNRAAQNLRLGHTRAVGWT